MINLQDQDLQEIATSYYGVSNAQIEQYQRFITEDLATIQVLDAKRSQIKGYRNKAVEAMFLLMQYNMDHSPASELYKLLDQEIESLDNQIENLTLQIKGYKALIKESKVSLATEVAKLQYADEIAGRTYFAVCPFKQKYLQNAWLASLKFEFQAGGCIKWDLDSTVDKTLYITNPPL